MSDSIFYRKNLRIDHRSDHNLWWIICNNHRVPHHFLVEDDFVELKSHERLRTTNYNMEVKRADSSILCWDNWIFPLEVYAEQSSFIFYRKFHIHGAFPLHISIYIFLYLVRWVLIMAHFHLTAHISIFSSVNVNYTIFKSLT